MNGLGSGPFKKLYIVSSSVLCSGRYTIKAYSLGTRVWESAFRKGAEEVCV